MTTTLFEVILPISKEYTPIANDILDLLSILLFTYIISRSVSSKKNIFESFPEFSLYLLIASLYNRLIVQNIIRFV